MGFREPNSQADGLRVQYSTQKKEMVEFQMSKHSKRNERYPFRVYKHWALNQWNYFQKPKLKRKVAKLKASLLNLWS